LGEIGYEDLDEHVSEHQIMLKDMEALKDTMNERLLLIKSGVRSGLVSPQYPH
jgi:hemerythrin